MLGEDFSMILWTPLSPSGRAGAAGWPKEEIIRRRRVAGGGEDGDQSADYGRQSLIPSACKTKTSKAELLGSLSGLAVVDAGAALWYNLTSAKA